jgi:integration host factor subunit beta
MTRSELVQQLMEKNMGLTLAQAEKAVDVVLQEISGALGGKKRVELRGFGVFSLRLRKPRVGRNPRTGEQVQVQQKYVPFFKAGKKLRDRVNTQ